VVHPVAGRVSGFEITGAPEPSGDFLANAQGEDVVSGVRNTQTLAEMAQLLPQAHSELIEALTLERHYRDRGIIDVSPFETLDEPGVGKLIRIGGCVGGTPTPS
jgi:phosphoenolpyruvate synthase/pyruvate phosphate dikinase